MDGHSALVLLSPQKKTRQYRLRYYQADSGKERFLGHLPFAQATLAESHTADGRWAFAISGTNPSTGHPLIVAKDTTAIHGSLDNASEAASMGYTSTVARLKPESKFVQQRATLGFALTF